MARSRNQATRYLVALGSNQRHQWFGLPERVLAAAMLALDHKDLQLERAGPMVRSAPLGPSRRRYANGAAIIKTKLTPPAMLARMKAIEAKFGRRRGGQRWSARVLDLDLVLWSGGMWTAADLVIPHPQFRTRSFVLGPACAIAGRWRDPLTGLSLRQLHARLMQPVPRGA